MWCAPRCAYKHAQVSASPAHRILGYLDIEAGRGIYRGAGVSAKRRALRKAGGRDDAAFTPS
jgi:hypothetical protein